MNKWVKALNVNDVDRIYAWTDSAGISRKTRIDESDLIMFRLLGIEYYNLEFEEISPASAPIESDVS